MPLDSAIAESAITPMLSVTLHDVTLSIGGKRLIEGLNMQLDAGRRTVIMGPNGAGKSLTLRLLQGLLTPTSGRIFWTGLPGRDSAGRRVVTVFQRPVLLRRSVAANLNHALKVYGICARERAGRVDRLLEQADLTALRDRPARVLSGGEQQRLSLVRALAAEPDLLLLDEPTTNLDPRSTEAIERLIINANLRGTKIVLVTHDAGQARRLADEIVFLQSGRVAEQTEAGRFFEAPCSPAARAYLAGKLYY